ncbi:MAG: hypothetical protein SFY80_06615 [Verrucomicrobiota bacterium]|nr:hypothetical protein [Verrucomicrobiota bacterium]
MLKQSSSYLLLDASSRRIHVGLLRAGAWLSLETTHADSLTGLFTATEAVLQSSSLTLAEVDGFICCRGPGSLLGLRLAAMAITGWHGMAGGQGRVLFSYLSLEAQALSLLASGHAPGFHLCSDYRENQWNFLSVAANGATTIPCLIDRPAIEALPEPLYFIPQRQREQPTPANAQLLDYNLAALPQLIARLTLTAVPLGQPMALHEPAPTTFVKWSAERHRKPEALPHNAHPRPQTARLG